MRYVIPIFAVTCLVVLTGCYEERVVSDSWGELRDLSDKKRGRRILNKDDTDPHRTPTSARRSFAWAIPLETFEGEHQQQRADRLMRRLERDFKVPNVWSRREGDQVHVYRGQYDDKKGKLARSALRQMQLLRIDGNLSYRDADLVRVPVAQDATVREMDLRGYSGRGFYSLQVEVYDDAVGDKYHQVAEERAATLRSEGEPAYYYHGPHRSMVLIGLFTEDEAFVTQIGGAARYSPMIKKLQERYPHNLYNGHTLVEKSGGHKIGEQSSFLVPVN